LALHLDTRPTRFLLVGTTGVAVSSVILLFTTRVGGLPTAWAGLLAGATATFTNFLLNDAFTWRERRSRTLHLKAIRLARYYSTTAIGSLISLSILVMLTDWLGLFVLLANLVAIGVGGSFNYVLHSLWTWRRGDQP
jgi:putative flippase GtrA